MKSQTVDLNSIIAIGNQVVGLVPRLMALAYFALLVILTFRVLKALLSKSGPQMGLMEIAAVAIAFGVAVR